MSGGAHFAWFILTLLTGLLALPLWIICALCYGSSQKKRDREMMRRNTEALEEMNRVNKWRGYRD